METLKDYKYELPKSPLQLRAGRNCNGKHVGYFHILGMPNDKNKADMGYLPSACFVLVSDGTKTGHIYPAMYNPEGDYWQIVSFGIHYHNGKIVGYLYL